MNFMENESEQKLRGGYYTPPDLAFYLSRWLLQGNPEKILEPSCGDGAFITAILDAGMPDSSRITGFELFPEEAAQARSRLGDHGDIITGDFLGWAIDRIRHGETPFDAVMGNPPFIRYQYLPKQFQERAEAIFRLLGLKFTKHTNAWVPFILACISLLQPGGRLAMVVPTEIIHVIHAQSLRTFLGSECARLLIIDPEEIWFADTLQGAVLLFAEKKMRPAEPVEGLGIQPIRGNSFLSEDPGKVFASVSRMNGKTVEGKWTKALLSASQLDLLDRLRDRDTVRAFGDVADVDVGIVTGANKFFLVSDDVVSDHELDRWAHPMFGRSEHCPGIIYNLEQHQRNSRSGTPTNFLWLRGDLSESALRYVGIGERQNLHTRYKCRIRTPWYTVPSVYSTKIGMLKRSHTTPRLIFNQAEAYTTDTAYRIRSHGTPEQKLVYCFINALTSLTAELEGRHYGGGVLELVPSEIEKLLVPVPGAIDIDLHELDGAVRSSAMERVVERQTRLVLGALGIAIGDQDTVLDAWERLRNRRHRVSPGEDEAVPSD